MHGSEWSQKVAAYSFIGHYCIETDCADMWETGAACTRHWNPTGKFLMATPREAIAMLTGTVGCLCWFHNAIVYIVITLCLLCCSYTKNLRHLYYNGYCLSFRYNFCSQIPLHFIHTVTPVAANNIKLY